MEDIGLRESTLTDFESYFTDLVNMAGIVVKGKRHEVGITFLSMFAGGHVLFEDNPGTGKTTLVKTLAALIGGEWSRVQITPDLLLPSDVTESA